MLSEQAGRVGYRPPPPPPTEDDYASENTKRFTVDSLLQIRPDVTVAAAAAAVIDKLHASFDG